MHTKKSTLDAVLESVACGVMITDKDLNVVRLNPSAQLITGWEEHEAVGRPCKEVLRPFLDGSDCPLRSCIRKGTTREEEIITVLNRVGDQIPVRVVSYVLFDDEHNLMGGIQTFGDIRTVHELRTRLARESSFEGILSRNHRMRAIFDVLPRLAESHSTVLVRGESGTGKELIAKALHSLSGRRHQPFISVNCAALPDTLLEAELFGYVKGAFTDARQDHEGRIAAANNGTLFIDEVGDLSPAMQVKLLRFLQDRSYEPLGSNKTRKADVRVVAATNRNLEELLQRGLYREDFFYRINVLTIDIPPLRDRKEDVPLLVDHFLQTWGLLNNRPTMRTTPLALRAMMAWDFPGNVRELENIVERAAVLAEDESIDLSNLPDELQHTVRRGRQERDKPGGIISSSSFSPMELSERETIRTVLEENEGNRQQAASELGISRATLWRKMKKYLLD
ncbi:sigma 54-interacting transcriptional regulator [bacterium]|nr:sigma 54-interacting transcriptional regulator [bacterium]